MYPNAFGLLGGFLILICFLIGGFALGRFTLDSYRAASWQVQIALVLAFFLLIVGVVRYASSGAAAGFVLGAAIAFLRDYMPKSEGKPLAEK
jgi:hypothetical protein